MVTEEKHTVAQHMRPSRTANADDLVAKVYRRMQRENLAFMIVKTEDGQLAGTLAKSVVGTLLNENGALVEFTELLEVKDFIDSRVVHIGPEASLNEAVRTMKENQIQCLIVQSGNQLLGILSLFDALPGDPES
ncbi:MAG: CBS domain-containing protein [Planctomycetota bacterium]|nr:CBS domain-containing protein [Planctomycetota bacterium]MDA1136959.1 CBS domain-containing protein [Planctomycetota bacterium]